MIQFIIQINPFAMKIIIGLILEFIVYPVFLHLNIGQLNYLINISLTL